MIKTIKSLNKNLLPQAFQDKKCKLRVENLTRWSSSFLMLESVKRAYDKGIFDDSENKCAYDLN